jgi:hypothetical protein
LPGGIENFEYRTVWGGTGGALRDGFRQDGFKLGEVGELTANVRQMGACDPVHVGTRSTLWPTQGEQGANLLKGEPEVAGTPDES